MKNEIVENYLAESGWAVFNDNQPVRCKYGKRAINSETGEEVPIIRRFNPKLDQSKITIHAESEVIVDREA
jgi:hypothetical protein